MNADIAKRNYNKKLWSIDMLKKLVEKNILTEEEFNNIVNPEQADRGNK